MGSYFSILIELETSCNCYPRAKSAIRVSALRSPSSAAIGAPPEFPPKYPRLHEISWIQRDLRFLRLHSPQLPAPLLHLQRPQQKPSPIGHHDQMARPWLNCAIDQQQVAVVHAPAPEAMAPHPHVEGAQGVGNQQAVQI